MNLNQLWRRLVRRPFVVLVILAIAGLAAYVGWTSATAETESRAAILVVPPWSFETEVFPNPVLNLSDRTVSLATTMVSALQAGDVRRNVLASGATDYEVTNLAPDSLRAPERSSVLQVVVKGPSQQAAHDGAVRLIDQSRLILAAMQEKAGVGRSPYWANLQILVPPEETMMSAGGRQVRGAVALGAVVFIAGTLVFLSIETIVERRSRSKARSRAGQSEFVPVQIISQNGHPDSTETQADVPVSPASRPT